MSSSAFKQFTIFAFLICAIFSLTTCARAQRQRMSVDDRVKHLTEQLSLSDSQAVSVKKIYAEAEVMRDSIFKAHGDDRSGMRDAMKTAMMGVDLKIEAVLSDSQKVAYDKVKIDRAQMMGGQTHEKSQKSDEKKPDEKKPDEKKPE